MNAMAPNLHQLWVYLAVSPLLGLTAMLIVYLIGMYLHECNRSNPMVNPLLITAVILGMLLTVTGASYKTYFDGVQFVHFLLGPVMVVLAVLLFQQWAKLHCHAVSPMVGPLVGLVVAVVSAVGIAWLLGTPPETLCSMASKSMVIPIAMGTSEKIGGAPTITAVPVLIIGIVGAMTTTRLLNLLCVYEYNVRGFATGITAHGIGTARALQVNSEAGAFSTLGMGLNGVLTTVLVSLLAGWIPR